MSFNCNDLEFRLLGRIERDGPITFREFMQAALYDPEHGYYNTERLKIGPQGDFYTSSNVHPAFGAVLARAFVQLWNELVTHPSQGLKIVEFGGGTGRLACDVLIALRDHHPQAFQKVEYFIIESSPEMRTREREQLAGFEGRVNWVRLEDLEHAPIKGVFFSNELVDSLPVHRLRFNRSGVEEQYVTIASGRLALSWAQPSTPNLIDYLNRASVKLAEGQIVEINLDAVDWLARVSRAMERGFLMTIDYGDLSPLLWAPDRRDGTLRSFYKHRLVDSSLERVGDQDMTASVNFTALIEYGGDFGLEMVTYERQVAFLVRMGLIDLIAEREDTIPSRKEVNERLALKNLFVPGGVSDNFRVLIQRKIGNLEMQSSKQDALSSRLP